MPGMTFQYIKLTHFRKIYRRRIDEMEKNYTVLYIKFNFPLAYFDD